VFLIDGARLHDEQALLKLETCALRAAAHVARAAACRSALLEASSSSGKSTCVKPNLRMSRIPLADTGMPSEVVALVLHDARVEAVHLALIGLPSGSKPFVAQS
jgi:hypothetical protein